MSFLSQTVPIPLWLFILMVAAMLPVLVKLMSLFFQFRRGDIVKEEQSDMVVWKIKNQRRIATPKTTPADIAAQKKHAEKADLVGVLKILLKEGDKGVRLQTVSDQMGTGLPKVQQAMHKLVAKKLVDEVAGMSGTKYYLTQLGMEYCRSRAR